MIGFIGFVFIANMTVMIIIVIFSIKRKLYLNKLKKETALNVAKIREQKMLL